MPTPLGHALAGIAAGAAYTGGRPMLGPRRDLVIFALLGQLPDLDFILGFIMGDLDYWHHGVSHSISAALLAGLVCFAWKLGRPDRFRWGMMTFWVVLSHVLLDSLNMDFSPPHGVPLFWPLSETHHIIYPFFLDVWREPPWLQTLAHNLWAMGLELLVLGPITLLVIIWQRYQQRKSANACAPDGLIRSRTGLKR